MRRKLPEPERGSMAVNYDKPLNLCYNYSDNIAKGCVDVKTYTKQELEECGFLSKLMGNKPSGNAWKEINNLLVDAVSADEISAAEIQEIAERWGAKFDDSSIEQRSTLYRKLADIIYSEALSMDDPLFAQGRHLAEALALPQHLTKLADKGAKSAAYFERCRKLLLNEEKLTVEELNRLFGYDYEDGLAARKQVFDLYFNLKFEAISSLRRYTPEQEEQLRDDCRRLDIPFEPKNNIVNALKQYRELWKAENADLSRLDPEGLPFSPEDGEICHAYANCGLCENKVVEREDNLFELTRKFNIDETVSFKGEKLEHPKITEEITTVFELGYFFLSSRRIIYISDKQAQAVKFKDIDKAEFDGVNIITFINKAGGRIMIKFADEAAEAVYILFNRALERYGEI